MAPATKQHQATVEGGMTADARCQRTAPLEVAVERVKNALHRRGSFTEIMRKALEFCGRERSFSEVEAEIATYPEFRYVECSQAAILDILVQVGALEKKSLDKGGNVIPAAHLRALSEDDWDDLVASFALATTEAGRKAIAAMKPAERLGALFAEAPERNEVYVRVMTFCRTPRSFEEVSALLEADAPMASRNPYTDLPLYPSAYLGHLEEAGGLVWDEGWRITEDGAAFLSAWARDGRNGGDE